jgi:hypothetical protein
VKSPRRRYEGHCDLSHPSVTEEVYLDLASAETRTQASERYVVVQRASGLGTDDGPRAGAAVVQGGMWAEARCPGGLDPGVGQGRACWRVEGPSGGLASCVSRAAAHIVP